MNQRRPDLFLEQLLLQLFFLRVLLLQLLFRGCFNFFLRGCLNFFFFSATTSTVGHISDGLSFDDMASSPEPTHSHDLWEWSLARPAGEPLCHTLREPEQPLASRNRYIRPTQFAFIRFSFLGWFCLLLFLFSLYLKNVINTYTSKNH